MKVYSLYLKIVKKNMASIIAYVIAFVFIALIFGGSNAEPTVDFEGVRNPVAFINNDEDTILISNLKKYLENYAYFKEVEVEDIPDALYFREIMIAFTVPEGFTEQFLKGEEVTIFEQSVPDAAAVVPITQALNKYLKRVKIYQDYTDDSLEEIINHVNNDLEKEVSATRSIVYDQSLNTAKFYYNYLSYLLCALIITVVCLIMFRINQLDVKRRMLVSPYPQSKFSFQLYLSHFSFSIIVLIVFVGLSFLLYKNRMVSLNGVLFIINAFIFMIPMLALAFLISNLIKNFNVIAAVVNVISLGSAFLSGAFVPQFLLGKTVLTIAHILPNYYYVANNERIAILTNFSWDNLKNIVFYMIIQLMFAVVLFAIALFIRIKKRKEENYADDQTSPS
jgi:ABC-2 type transport system permease protein